MSFDHAAAEERIRQLEHAVAKREGELAILSRVASRIHGEEGVQQILDIALEEILQSLGLSTAWVFMGDEKELHLAAQRGVDARYLDEIRTQGLGSCLCPEVFATGHTMQARNTLQCPRMPTIVAGLDAPVAHACIPLRFEGHSRGVLNVAARSGEQFSHEELRFLETVGHQVCIAVERAGHLRAERLRNQEARAMAAINRAMGGSLDVAVVLKAVGDSAREVLAADNVYIFLGTDPQAMKVAHLSGDSHPELVEGQQLDLVAIAARLQVRALEEQRAFVVHDFGCDERANHELARRWNAGSGILLPLLARHQPHGLLGFTRTAPHRWSEEQIEMAEALAAQASVAIENARLYEQARRSYDELRDAQVRIIQNEKMAVVGTFAAGLAHEVRNPLNSIALQVSILERRINRAAADTSGEMGHVIGIIRDEVKRLDALVGDFLLFSRTNRVNHLPNSLDLLLDDVFHLLGPEAKAGGVSLTRASAGAPVPALRMDGERIKQVVINLVKNALEALAEARVSGGAVVVESGLMAGGRVRVAVHDNGPGLPEGLDIFQLFVTTKAKGTGLGLSIAQQIVLEHGGEIRAHSAAGTGTSFVFTLPADSRGMGVRGDEEPGPCPAPESPRRVGRPREAGRPDAMNDDARGDEEPGPCPAPESPRRVGRPREAGRPDAMNDDARGDEEPGPCPAPESPRRVGRPREAGRPDAMNDDARGDEEPGPCPAPESPRRVGRPREAGRPDAMNDDARGDEEPVAAPARPSPRRHGTVAKRAPQSGG